MERFTHNSPSEDRKVNSLQVTFADIPDKFPTRRKDRVSVVVIRRGGGDTHDVRIEPRRAAVFGSTVDKRHVWLDDPS